jgi:heme-degrading monooxygenase HmoA
MIVRVWRSRASHENADAYPAHFRDKVVPELHRVPGFVGAELLRRDLADDLEYTVLTRWRDLAAVKAFAGSDPTRAVVEPAAAVSLVEFDEHVTHHELVHQVTV